MTTCKEAGLLVSLFAGTFSRLLSAIRVLRYYRPVMSNHELVGQDEDVE